MQGFTNNIRRERERGREGGRQAGRQAGRKGRGRERESEGRRDRGRKQGNERRKDTHTHTHLLGSYLALKILAQLFHFRSLSFQRVEEGLIAPAQLIPGRKAPYLTK